MNGLLSLATSHSRLSALEESRCKICIIWSVQIGISSMNIETFEKLVCVNVDLLISQKYSG